MNLDDILKEGLEGIEEQQALEELKEEERQEYYRLKAIRKAEDELSNRLTVDNLKDEVETIEIMLDTIKKEYDEKKESIVNDIDLTDEAKGKKLDTLYEKYRAEAQAKINKRDKIRFELFQQRKEKATELLGLRQKKESIGDISPGEIMYLQYMIDKADDTSLLALADEYNHHKAVLSMINARDMKIPRFNKEGQVNKKLVIKHPLESIIEERQNDPKFTSIKSAWKDYRDIENIVSSSGVPSRDPWSNYKYKDEKTIWD